MVTPTLPYSPWITCPKPLPQAALRLFCFPYAGAGASAFRAWADDLPPTIELCPIQLPGRENQLKQPPFTNLLRLSQTLALLPYLDRPFVFLGHSMGALVSFEVIRQLRRQQAPLPLQLVVSGRRAPQIPHRVPAIHQLSDDGFIAALQQFGGTSPVVWQNAELRQLFLPVLRADFAMLETYIYRPEAPIDCPISAFGGRQDPETLGDNLSAWRDQTSRHFSLRLFPGGHFFIKHDREGFLQALEHRLMEYLRDASPLSQLNRVGAKSWDDHSRVG
jgi:medium-chain acyl-[acyl-carrier-protein] hydrolase